MKDKKIRKKELEKPEKIKKNKPEKPDGTATSEIGTTPDKLPPS